MKKVIELSPLVTATLYTGKDVPAPRPSPMLTITSFESVPMGLGWYGEPSGIEISGEAAVSALADLLTQRHVE